MGSACTLLCLCLAFDPSRPGYGTTMERKCSRSGYRWPLIYVLRRQVWCTSSAQKADVWDIFPRGSRYSTVMELGPKNPTKLELYLHSCTSTGASGLSVHLTSLGLVVSRNQGGANIDPK